MLDVPPAIVQQVESRTDGKITKVEGNRITLERLSGKVTTFTLTRDAEVRQDGRLIERTALRVGQRCRVVFDPANLESRAFGVYVNIDPPPPLPRP